MRRLMIRVLITLSATTMLFCSFACSRTDQKLAGPVENITIAYTTPPYSALADIAKAKEYFRQEGLEVTPLFRSTGKAGLDELLAGRADFATVADTPFMFAVMKGEKIGILATIQTSDRTNVIIAKKDKGIHTPEDLKGKRIGVALGTYTEFFLDTFLTVHGISRQDVTLVNLKPDDMPEALANGDVDAATAWPPFLNRAQKRLGDNGVIFHDRDIYTFTLNIVAKQEYIRANPGKIRKLLLALIRAEDFVSDNPDEAKKVIADFRQMDRALINEMWGGNTFGVTLNQSLVLALEDESRWAIKRGLTGKGSIPNYFDHIYFDGLRSIKPDAVKVLR